MWLRVVAAEGRYDAPNARAPRLAGYRLVGMKNPPDRTTIGLDKIVGTAAATGRAELRNARLPRGFRTPALLHHQRRAAHPAPGHRPGRDQGVGGLVRWRGPDLGPRTCPVRDAAAA